MSEQNKLKELISQADLKNRIKEIAKEISLDYQNDSVVFVIVLNGGFIFGSDLIRSVDLECEVDFVKVSSYKGTLPNNDIKLEKDLSINVAGKNVIIVEDIIDTGNTIKYLVKLIESYLIHLLKLVIRMQKTLTVTHTQDLTHLSLDL
jgi:hypoxanthine phosphoribosyltransferase